MKRFLLAVGALSLAGVFIGVLRAGDMPVGETIGALALGWWRFIARVLPRQHVNASGAATAVVSLVLFLFGLHAFLAWLARAWGADDAVSTQPRRWRLRWTAYLVGLSVLAFAAGIAFVGIVHQSLWLATSPLPRTTMAPDPSYLGRPDETPKFIHMGLVNYLGNTVPPGDDPEHTGNVQHSWQTLILPYLAISNQGYDLTHTWNDPANRNFCSRPVEEYLIRGVPGDVRDDNGYAVSHYAGNQHVFVTARDRALKWSELSKETLLFGEAAGNFRPWADPGNVRDPLQGLNTSAHGFGNAAETGAYFAEAGGRVRFLSRDVDPQLLRRLSAAELSGERSHSQQ